VRVAKAGFTTMARELDVSRDGHETIALAESAPTGPKLPDPGRGGLKPDKPDRPVKKDRPTHRPRPTPGEEEPAKL